MIGADVKRARVILGSEDYPMKQVTLAAKLGVTSATISAWERKPEQEIGQTNSLAVECLLRRAGKVGDVGGVPIVGCD